MNKNERNLKRYALDNSSLFYPIMATKKAQSIFRVEVELDETVSADLLSVAANGAINRFPTFKVRLKKGYAWHYLEENNEEVVISKDNGNLLRPINPDETNGFLFRVAYCGNRISLEVFHGLCDGNGAIVFLKGIVQKYRELQGRSFDNVDGAIDFSATDDGEIEDSYLKHYSPIKFGGIDVKGLTGSAPHLLTGTIDENGYSSVRGECDYLSASKLAKENDATFTAYTAGLLAYAIEKTDDCKRPIVMMVPVNLRTVFPSSSVRNFVTFVRLVFKPLSLKTIEDFVASAKKQLAEKATKEKLSAMISTTVRAEKTSLLRLSPLWFKTGVAKFIRLFLKSRQTIILSNLGRTDMPDGYGVNRVFFNVNVSKNAKVNLGVTSTGGRTIFSFTKSIVENDLPQNFFDLLRSNGVSVESV